MDIENSIKKFHDIGLEYKTDKISTHGYHRYYAHFLDINVTKLLEIGINRGSSIPLWLNYLPNAYVYGMDISLEYEGEKYKIIKGDQSKIECLENVANIIGEKIDLIIDDGSHVPEHQIISFNFLFPNLLKDGGVYIIEDIECNYWKKGNIYGYETEYGINSKKNIINMFMNIIHILNKKFISKEELIDNYKDTDIDVPLNTIESIFFGRNFIAIKKKKEREYENIYNDNEKYMYNQNI